jgi:Pentapeptide repeats (8 copies)
VTDVISNTLNSTASNSVLAIFRAPNFAHASLQQASFEGADLSGAIFYGSNLSHADLQGRLFRDDKNLDEREIVGLSRITGDDALVRLPGFECADLRGANFGGRPLVWVDVAYLAPESNDDKESRIVTIWATKLKPATIDGTTNFSPLGLVWSVDVPTNYRSQNLRALLQESFPFEQSSYYFFSKESQDPHGKTQSSMYAVQQIGSQRKFKNVDSEIFANWQAFSTRMDLREERYQALLMMR